MINESVFCFYAVKMDEKGVISRSGLNGGFDPDRRLVSPRPMDDRSLIDKKPFCVTDE